METAELLTGVQKMYKIWSTGWRFLGIETSFRNSV